MFHFRNNHQLSIIVFFKVSSFMLKSRSRFWKSIYKDTITMSNFILNDKLFSCIVFKHDDGEVTNLTM